MKNDRLFIAQDIRADGVELFWKADCNGIGTPDVQNWAGAAYILADSGAMHLQFTDKDGTPYLFVLDSIGARIVITDDYTGYSQDCEVAFGIEFREQVTR